MGPPENRDAEAGECLLYLRNKEEKKRLRTEELETRAPTGNASRPGGRGFDVTDGQAFTLSFLRSLGGIQVSESNIFLQLPAWGLFQTLISRNWWRWFRR